MNKETVKKGVLFVETIDKLDELIAPNHPKDKMVLNVFNKLNTDGKVLEIDAISKELSDKIQDALIEARTKIDELFQKL